MVGRSSKIKTRLWFKNHGDIVVLMVDTVLHGVILNNV